MTENILVFLFTYIATNKGNDKINLFLILYNIFEKYNKYSCHEKIMTVNYYTTTIFFKVETFLSLIWSFGTKEFNT